MTHLPVSAFLTSLPLDFPAAARQAAELGFTHVDVVARADRPAGHYAALADAGVIVACAALGRGLSDGQSLDAAPFHARRAAVEAVKRDLADAARLGAACAYLVPGTDGSPAALARFGEACTLLAEYAAGRRVRLCVEHVPGRALPTAAAALSWLGAVGHDNLALLLDTGHCLISGEDAAAAALRAGRRLGYVHLDDNDGTGDLHWPLLTGRLTATAIGELLAALRTIGHDRPVSLELNPLGADAVAALRDGNRLVEEMWLALPPTGRSPNPVETG